MQLLLSLISVYTSIFKVFNSVRLSCLWLYTSPGSRNNNYSVPVSEMSSAPCAVHGDNYSKANKSCSESHKYISRVSKNQVVILKWTSQGSEVFSPNVVIVTKKKKKQLQNLLKHNENIRLWVPFFPMWGR